ncbi:hypothetical protein BGL48_04970 [Salinivibrio sp. SS3]|nr:hypothetical protein BGL48_04970 [Salinivibrio sp. BNH]
MIKVGTHIVFVYSSGQFLNGLILKLINKLFPQHRQTQCNTSRVGCFAKQAKVKGEQNGCNS